LSANSLLPFRAKEIYFALPEELDGSAKDFFAAIKAESDRGCVLVAAAF
jgi:hypothetical protein